MEPQQNSRPVVGLLGATGITGRTALAHLLARAPEAGVDVVVGARDPERVRALCAERDLPVPEVLHASCRSRSVRWASCDSPVRSR